MIAELVINWQKDYGRNHLPWQNTKNPYHVWLSEIMLQQTQVSTVLNYYPRFLERFPNIAALASATEDEVLALWSGLGYYSRARNLHLCAKQVVELHGGSFPATAQVLQTLPGIGRSTAGAIAGFCFAERVPILDANVRRVLTRVLGFDQDLSIPGNERLLWERAAALLPSQDLEETMPRYTQGLMDLGAMVCTPRNPSCLNCPLQSQCIAFQQGVPENYPVKTRKLTRKSETWWLLILRDPAGRVLLNRRPSTGIWAGLYCLPIYSERTLLTEHPALTNPIKTVDMPSFLHTLTHRDLHLHPVVVDIKSDALKNQYGFWFEDGKWNDLGLPAPIRKLLNSLQESS